MPRLFEAWRLIRTQWKLLILGSGLLFACGFVLYLSIGLGIGYYLSFSGFDDPPEEDHWRIRSTSKASINLPPLGTKVHAIHQILANLDTRRSWPAETVKIRLRSPTVIARTVLPNGSEVHVHAWPGNQNDFDVPMVRIQNGNLLYEVTVDEYARLSDGSHSGITDRPHRIR